MVTLFDKLIDKIYHGVNPYLGFNDYQPSDLQSWGVDHPIFPKLINEIKPNLIIEVGSWKGASALRMASLSDSVIICIDTWLGEEAFYLEDKWRPSLKLKNGRATMYNTFMSNVIGAGQSRRIIPLSLPSANAARYLKALGIEADLIYIDASHESPDVYNDLCAYWELLRKGGALFGDDYTPHFGNLMMDVNRFAQENNFKFNQDHEKYWFYKEK